MGPIQDRTQRASRPDRCGRRGVPQAADGRGPRAAGRHRAQGRRRRREPLCRARRRRGRRAGQGSRRRHDRALRPSRAAMSASNTGWATDAEPGRQRIPDAQRPGHADGRAVAPLLDAGAAVARNCPSATARRRRSGSWARTCSRSATPTAGSASSSRTARIAAPISTTGATRSAACAAPSTAGSSTSRATASTCRLRRPKSTYKDTIKLLAYPVREWGDMIWVYMGPRDTMPELPQLEMGLVPAAQRYVSKKWQDCNWVQSLEGAHRHRALLVPARGADQGREGQALEIYSRIGGARRPVEARRSRPLGDATIRGPSSRSSATTPGW